ncbi:Hcp beta-lactamase protein [Phytophthora nicotianae]|uniref:Hcp beta-lactamase protein n=1 Tax=Phytophthora nicotianae TaxID=4792 RepID=A0A0W8DQ32_PHYNI|nr:Hcp beta-lactamase protein [Phytophthora nicotianae]
MSSREASKKAAKELLALCTKEGVKIPTGEFQLDAALKEMIKKFGAKESASPKKKGKTDVKTEKKTGRKRKSAEVKDEDGDDADEDEKKTKKPRKKAEATCEDNQALADAFAELSGFEFKRGEKFKGGTWSKVAKAIRDCETKLTCGKDALKLKGVGKSSAAKIDEFLETGTLEKLEEYRAGNM